ncbi:hypothetical protein BSKO_04515 [Bryopsis sp. KO-2023]|nr:hypothetical protein BSKO_04515 [Bryopsis sp. KO-2023]
MPATYILFESASGFSLFEFTGLDEIGNSTAAVRKSVNEFERFGSVVKLVAFRPFESAASALSEINTVSEGQLSDDLKNFLTMSLPKVKAGKKPKFEMGVSESKLGSVIQEETGIPCFCRELSGELIRGVRVHFSKYVKQLEDKDLAQAQLGLAHSYSRAKVKFNVNRVDNMVIQAIGILDTLDKDINTFVMRVREWYSWHFPELVKVVNDNYQYAKCCLLIKDKSEISEQKHLEGLTEIVGSEETAKEIIEAGMMSMGQDISPIDLVNIEAFAKRVIGLVEYRHKLMSYLQDKMHGIAPNLSALIGEVVGARLISQAGSLTNLAKSPASTIQILGAEKALFRALKTKGNTPKYGLIFHSSFIGKAATKNKGRISRYVAGKCAMASRIDCFMDQRTMLFGEKMKEQVEQRLRFYEEGVEMKPNVDMMGEAMAAMQKEHGLDVEMKEEGAGDDGEGKKKKKKKKKKDKEAVGVDDDEMEDIDKLVTPKKKKKKSKKPADTPISNGGTELEEILTTPEVSAKKSKKKRKGEEESGMDKKKKKKRKVD